MMVMLVFVIATVNIIAVWCLHLQRSSHKNEAHITALTNDLSLRSVCVYVKMCEAMLWPAFCLPVWILCLYDFIRLLYRYCIILKYSKSQITLFTYPHVSFAAVVVVVARAISTLNHSLLLSLLSLILWWCYICSHFGKIVVVVTHIQQQLIHHFP